MTEVFCKALPNEHMYDLLECLGDGLIEYLPSISFSGKKCIQVIKKKRMIKMKKKYELKPKQKFTLSVNRSL